MKGKFPSKREVKLKELKKRVAARPVQSNPGRVPETELGFYDTMCAQNTVCQMYPLIAAYCPFTPQEVH